MYTGYILNSLLKVIHAYKKHKETTRLEGPHSSKDAFSQLNSIPLRSPPNPFLPYSPHVHMRH